MGRRRPRPLRGAPHSLDSFRDRKIKERSMPHTFATAGKIITGPGALKELGSVTSELGRRAILVSGGGSLEKAGNLDLAREALNSAGVELEEHAGVKGEPDLAIVTLLRGRMREGRCDAVVAIGGGSVIDAAKAAAGLVNEPAPAREYQTGRSVTKPGVPLIAVPTTAGTGTEVTPNAVITDPEGPRKVSIRGPTMFPHAAIIDPEMLLSLPPKVTAESGMDALVQATEAHVSRKANPISEALSLQAVKLLARGLLRSYEDASDLDARTNCAHGALMSGMALSSARLGVVHGLAHPVGARTKLPHGLVCAVLFAPSIRLNVKSAGARYAELARALEEGLVESGRSDVPRGEPLDRLVEWMLERLGLPRKLPGGIPASAEEDVTRETLASGSTRANPLKIEPKHVRKLLGEVFAGAG